VLTAVTQYATNMPVVTPLTRSHLPGTLRNTHSTRSQLVRTLDSQRVDISVDKSPVRRDRTRKWGLSTVGDKVEKQIEKTRHTFLDNMDVIAYGIQLRFEENSGFSRRVTEATVDIARALGIPEAEIKRWAASRFARLVRDTEKLREIKSHLERLQGSFLDRADNKIHPPRAIRS